MDTDTLDVNSMVNNNQKLPLNQLQCSNSYNHPTQVSREHPQRGLSGHPHHQPQAPTSKLKQHELNWPTLLFNSFVLLYMLSV